MNKFPRILTLLFVSFVMLSLTSCRSPELQAESSLSPEPTDPSTERQDPASTNLASQPPTSQPKKPAANSPALKEPTAPANTVPVTIYRVDSECSKLVPQQVTVSEDRPIEDAVAKTLEIQQFELPLGYRVEVDDYYQVAVIDFRVPATSRRTLESLSACEQFTLFESLRETLTTNSNWEIRDVYFTNLGEDLIL